jgi:hypothetical protein
MTTEKASFPFDERNQQDFMLVTKRIQDALALMASDKRVKRTETNLAKLATCSRTTLHNRKWPLEQLQKLKEEARTAKAEPEPEPRATRDKARVERYREQLMKNRDELLLWKYKHDTLRDLVETLEAQRDALKNRVEELEQQLRAMAVSKGSRKLTSKVLPFSVAGTKQKGRGGK